MSDPTVHVTPNSAGAAAPSTNPLSDGLNIAVSLPEQITVKMVDASALSEYEIWFFIASLTSSAFVGFFVPYLQAREAHQELESPLFYMSAFVLVLFLVAMVVALVKRATLTKKTRVIKLKTTSATF